MGLSHFKFDISWLTNGQGSVNDTVLFYSGKNSKNKHYSFSELLIYKDFLWLRFL